MMNRSQPRTASNHDAVKPKREALNLRIHPDERSLIDRAAEVKGKNRTDFILDAAMQAAEAALLDQVIIAVNPDAYAEFMTRLDQPAKSNDRLRVLLNTPAPWDK